MKRRVWFVVAAICLALLAAAAEMKTQSSGSGTTDRPEFTGTKDLKRPENYRAWVFLSSGYGMTYSTGGDPQFTNVFVPQWAYREFMGSGRWPDQTMFVVEERSAQSKGSINKDGHFQTDLTGIAVEVKDARLPDKWGYFVYDDNSKTAQISGKEGCFACHDAHAAVEHTFVQFYPTLKPVAKKFGTYNQERENVAGGRLLLRFRRRSSEWNSRPHRQRYAVVALRWPVDATPSIQSAMARPISSGESS